MKQIILIMLGLSSILSADFTRDANNEIVTDNITGLEWQDNTIPSRINWQSAIDQCENLSLGEHEDWRLPNVKELSSLVEDTKYSPSINDIFENTESNGYWTSTTRSTNTNLAWVVYFSDGKQNGRSYKVHTGSIRCVRGGL